MNEQTLERIARALERQVEQVDEQVARNQRMREENLQLRRDDQYRSESDSYRFDSQMREVLDIVAQVKEQQAKMVALYELATKVDAVDPHDGSEGTPSTRV